MAFSFIFFMHSNVGQEYYLERLILKDSLGRSRNFHQDALYAGMAFKEVCLAPSKKNKKIKSQKYMQELISKSKQPFNFY